MARILNLQCNDVIFDRSNDHDGGPDNHDGVVPSLARRGKNAAMKLSSIALFALFLGLFACSTPPSGGGAGILCALDGTCPAAMVCGGQYCIPVSTDAVNGDGGGTTMSDGAATDTTAATVDVGGKKDTTQPTDTVVKDAGTADAGTPDTGSPDIGSTDTGAQKPDTAPTDTTITPTGGIVAWQQAGASKTCANLTGEQVVNKSATLSGVVATSNAAKLGKIMVFYVRPGNAPKGDGSWQGIKVVVFKGASTVKAGDILTLSGTLVEYYCESELKVDMDKIQVTGKANLPPTPYSVVPPQIAGKGTQGEAFEGVYVELNNVTVVVENVIGTDGKPHGQFGVAAAGGTSPVVVIGGSAGTSFSVKDAKTGNIVTTMKKGTVYKSLRGHLTYSFETYILRPSSDADLVVK